MKVGVGLFDDTNKIMISKELEIDDPVAERFQAFQAPYATVFKFLGRVHDAVIELQSNHWGISQMLH
jgi:hypothetical protein